MKITKAQLARAKVIRAELTKVRCWLTGFKAGRQGAGTFSADSHIPGDDALRQAIIFLDEMCAEGASK